MIQPRNHVFLPANLTTQIDGLKTELGLSSRPQVIGRLVSEHQTSKLEQGKSYASFEIMQDRTPAIITGASGLGKTTTIKLLLNAWQGPILALDYIGEYLVDDYLKVELTPVEYSEVMTFLKRDGRGRYVPPEQVSAESMIRGLLIQLDGFMRQKGCPLARWLVVIEEADHFVKDDCFKSLLGESRHFVGKLLVSLKRASAFREVAPIYRPLPWTHS